MSSYNLILCFAKTGISKRCDFGVVLTQKKCIYKNREVCVKSLRQILGILRILTKKNYCAVIASHRRSNPYACRLLRHFIPRNDNLTEDLNLVYNKPLSASLLKRGRRDYGWIARPFPSGGYPERMNKLSYCIFWVNLKMK